MSHAKLAPSSAHRWIECYGSVALCADVPDRDSVYAREGTFVHDIAARCLEQGKDAHSYLNIKSDDGEFTVTEEMCKHVNDYCELIEALATMWGGKPLIETRVQVSEHIWGTADAILLSSDGKVLHVIDLKYGKGKIVEAEGNYQALSYAIGALNSLDPVAAAAVQYVVIHIYQPRAGGDAWREWEVSPAGIDSARDTLLRAESQILAGNQELKTGAWCQFCDAAATCPARHAEARAAARDVFADNVPPPVETLTPEQVARIIELTPRVEDWLKAIHDLAVRKLERGEAVPGYKLVEKTGNRKWRDETATRDTLSLYGIDPNTAPKLISPAEAERRISAASVKLSVGSMVERPVTGQALVPESDKRPAKDPRAAFLPPTN